MTECFFHVTCFAKVSEKVVTKTLVFYHKEVSTHHVRCYHSFLVEIIFERVNLIQMSK